ncbi:MAG: MATE family efflux transporter [Clostridia bacterium]|nr:MATE family efflux transporter [Clostridia bacterium]
MDEKIHTEQRTQSAPPPAKARVTTTLDSLPAGSAGAAQQKINTKQPLPEGITSRMLYKDILRIGWPALVELMLTQLTSMADTMMVGRLGAWALSAVGLTMQPKMLLATAFMALNTGTMALVGRYRGAGNQKKARLVLRQGFMLNGILGLIFALIGIVFSKQLVIFMGPTEEKVLIEATKYLQVQLIGMFTLSMTSCITSTLRGSGDSKTAMIYNTTANVVNVAGNYLLIYGHFGFPRLEVLGASIATVLGQFVAFLMAIRAVRKNTQYVRLEFPKGSIRPDFECIGNIARIGVPSMVEQLAMRFGVIVFTKTVTGLGTIAYATHQVCMNIQALTFMNGQAFATSATSLVSQSLGKNRPDMALHYSRRTQRTGMCVAICIAVFVFTCNKFVLGLYTDEAAIITTGSSLLSMIALIQPFQSSQFILAGALRGAGDTKYTAMVTMLTVMLLRPSLAILLIKQFDMGLHGAWYALVADQLLRTLLVFIRYRSGKWTTSFKHNAAAEADN